MAESVKKVVVGGFVLTIILVAIVFYVCDDHAYNTEAQQDKSGKIVAIPRIKAEPTPVYTDDKIGKNESIPQLPRKGSSDELVIKFKDANPSITPIDEPDQLSDIYPQLLTKAENGDLEALNILLSQLVRCNNSWRSKAGLDKALAEIKRNGRVQLNEKAPIAVAASEEFAIQISSAMKADYEHCKSMTNSQLLKYRDLASLGSKMGDLQSTTIAIKDADNEYEKQLLERILWDDIGHVNGLTALSEMYFDGVVDKQGVRGEPDYKLAYAYARAEKLIYEAWNSEGQHFDQVHTHGMPSSSVHYELFKYLEEKRVKYASYLSASEEIEAEEIAVNLIKENKNCCAVF